ncbi:MAG: hypothetical protein ACU837_10515 [Gammaproteobacteria bacterium]
MKNSFFLVIPAQQADSERVKMFEEASLQQWIADLPVANPGLTVKLLHDLIEEFISLEMDVQLRLSALERIRPSFLIIQEFMRTRLMKAGFPKTENEFKTLEILIEIEKSFSIGYWIVVKVLTRSRDIGWFKAKNVALALQRVIKGLSDVVISIYMMALPMPDWIWIDLHSLYKLSVRVKKETSRVSDETVIISKTSTPLESYLQIVLLSLAEPDGMMQKEVLEVYQFVEKIVPYVSLESKPVAGQVSQCLILMDEDKPPLWVGRDFNHADSHVNFLDFSKLYKAFKHKEKFINASDARFSSMNITKNKPDKISPELLDYLESRWTGITSRGTPFFVDRLNRYFAIGLDAAYNLQTSLQKEGEVEAEYLAESASDRSLSCRFQKHGVISIGSLISFRRVDLPEHKRSLGVVSKITRTKADGTVEFEIKALAPQAHAVNYVPIGAEKSDPPQRALIYGVKEGEEEKSYLIVESFMFKEEDILRLFIGGENFPIVLRDRKNVGLGYWQFECRRIPEQMVPKPETSKKGYDFI